MTEHRYLQVFGDTADALLRLIGVDFAYVEAGHSYYTVESHLRHLCEAKLGQALYTTLQVLAADDIRIHYFTTIKDAVSEQVLATAEQMMLHVDSSTGKTVAAPQQVRSALAAIANAHATLDRPAGVGRSVGQKR